ncbi:MAG: response regulator, partial [Chloroflexota bacterium]|nr:response regulator [Chloroflexota bacterium]
MAQGLPETQDSLILLVEDDPYIREFLALMLSEEGFRTAEAANGAEALRLAALQQPSLVVSDIMMPVLNGYDLVMRL